MNTKGITIAGNILTDKIKLIDAYPSQGMLCNISKVEMGVGGAVPNTIIDLAVLDPTVPLKAVGLVGDDAEGRFVVGMMKDKGVDVSGIGVIRDQPTSFSDVMTVTSTGARTFFHARGANSVFGPEHIDLDKLDCDLFHIGYLLLLDQFDREDPEYGTVMARTLHEVQKRGIKTSIDVVSEASDRFKKLVIPALKYCDYVVINEIESGNAVGVDPRTPDGRISLEALKEICRRFMELGVKEVTCIHSREVGVYYDKAGNFTWSPAVNLPKGYIKGAVGAGDAFCAGMLYSFYKGFSAKQALDVASCTAGCNLSAPDSVSGMKPLAEALELLKIYGSETL